MKKYTIYIILFSLVLVSFIAFLQYYSTGANLLYADAISRLNIARKVIDNITPGLPQLGNVWLPLPQMLMLPFIWNNFLWHSGIAGAIMSMSSFILGGFFVYKSARLLSKSIVGSVMALSVYALNINLLYLQTTAMSESLFVCTLAATIYYFLKFFKTFNSFYLISAAIAVSSMTLTRYEGLAILLPSIPIVFFYSLYKSKRRAKAESNALLYGVLACLGFTLWTFYLTVIYGDPLYWKNYYADASVIKETGVRYYSQAKPFHAAIWQYFTSTIWMIGLFPILLSFIAFIVMLVKDIRKKTFYFLPLLMPLAIFLFMVLTLQRNTPIVQPTLNLESILSPETSLGIGFNIRYGLLLLPWVAIMTAYLFTFKNKLLKTFTVILFMGFMGIQVYSYFDRQYSVIYQIPARIQPKEYADLVNWMKKNYDDGYILVSAASHEDQMFEMGFQYDTYIHEGIYKYWKETLDDPSRYAKWVIIDTSNTSRDAVAKKHGIITFLQRDYNLMYDKEQVQVYKIKKNVHFDIKKVILEKY